VIEELYEYLGIKIPTDIIPPDRKPMAPEAEQEAYHAKVKQEVFRVLATNDAKREAGELVSVKSVNQITKYSRCQCE
jgi:hypothetical protein